MDDIFPVSCEVKNGKFWETVAYTTNNWAEVNYQVNTVFHYQTSYDI